MSTQASIPERLNRMAADLGAIADTMEDIIVRGNDSDDVTAATLASALLSRFNGELCDMAAELGT